jgi:hypothetical protein
LFDLPGKNGLDQFDAAVSGGFHSTISRNPTR